MTTRRAVALGIAVLAAIGLVATALFAISAIRDGRRLEGLLGEAQKALSDGDWDAAEAGLVRLRDESEAVSRRLGGPVPSVLRIVPVAGRTVRTVRTVVAEGGVAADAALSVLPSVEGGRFWQGGRIDVDALRSLGAAASAQRDGLEGALERARTSPGWPLPGPVARARVTLIERLDGAVRGTEVAGAAADLVERLFGGAGARRYFIAFENPAELRGGGGLWGNYGILEAEDGRLRLGQFGRAQEDLARFAGEPGPQWYADRYERFAYIHDWRQLPTGPDFPTVASIAESNLQDAGDIGPVAGTIAIDPLGLEAMLRITGPIRVEGWPEPLDADNITDVTLHDAYGHFETNDERIDFLGTTAIAVWSAFLDSDISASAIAGSGLGDAIAAKHLRFHLTSPEEQALAERLGADGSVGDPDRTFALVLQNTAGHKMDYWLHRAMDLDVQLEGDGTASGSATIKLSNRGLSSGEPRYVIGPFDDSFRIGWNYQLVRLYLPRGTSVRPSDEAQIASELGFVVVEWDVAVPPGGEIERTIDFEIEDLWDPDSGRIDFTVRKQVSIHPDQTTFSVKPPWGRRLDVGDEGSCPDGPQTTDLLVSARMRGSVLGWVIGPWARDISCGAVR